MEYKLEFTEWDKSNGIAPKLLTIARARAKLITEKTMQQGNTQAQADFNRGVYSELKSLIKSLEDAGVQDAS
jgi:hypothetical protein